MAAAPDLIAMKVMSRSLVQKEGKENQAPIAHTAPSPKDHRGVDKL
jgi:hypothetical protein